ncbi:chemotaxis protein MotA [Natranaerovirga hydrolytica]|uniref:Chemotaxis protein MotA n=1 Tax=Natranaerovirga hydrolytica TaxID=680378 RepID=A0A4R1MXA9_9FIRM|nr:MotA/TolQ/ExbB proton channel family protein [Natranaerovirga hydrolytica]TCK97898.1 chemotaxis protein MotA [Natranaerovirga hydrolytica]
MDIASIVGIIAGIFFLLTAVLLRGDLGSFADAASVMIVLGGTIAASAISYPLKKFLNSLKAIKLIFKNTDLDEGEAIKRIIDLSNVARKEGLLALEEATQNIEDDFLKKGVLLIVDGTDPELVRSILETEMAFIENRHNDVQGFWTNIGTLAPAWGMIGTLIGLITMLETMDDPASVGPSMSVALITTLYGSLIANFLAIPIASKLKIRSAEEILLKEVMIEGLLSIQAGENPRVIEEKLKAFLSPTLRNNLNDQQGANAGNEEGVA